MLSSGDVLRAMRFYQALGFTIKGTFGPADSPAWCYLEWPGAPAAALMLKRLDASESKAVLTGALYLYPDDIKALWARLKDEVNVVFPLTRFIYKMSEFSIRDSDGYQLIFGQDDSEIDGVDEIPRWREPS